MRKANGQQARLSFSAHALMENRYGLLVDLKVALATRFAERETAIEMLERQARKHVKPRTLGADKAYDTSGFVSEFGTAYNLMRMARILREPVAA